MLKQAEDGTKMKDVRLAERGGRTLAASVRALYQEGQSDYWLEPLVLAAADGTPVGRIGEQDEVIFCCRRGEREVELTEAFVDPAFEAFPRIPFRPEHFVLLTLYHEKFRNQPVAFAPQVVPQTVSEVLSHNGKRQLHVAESEKFSHVTFFFNGGRQTPFAGEEDRQVPTPRGVPFPSIPALNVAEVVTQCIEGMKEGQDLVLVNFANGDVLGHLPDRQAKIECAKAVDEQLGRLLAEAQAQGYVSLITADHGILEVMEKESGKVNVSHTSNPVPLFLVDPLYPVIPYVGEGKLADVAPTVLSILGLPPSPLMTGRNLAPRALSAGARRVLWVILDGWGIGAEDENNPIFLAQAGVWKTLMQRHLLARLAASGEAVGLEPGKPGNSEAGHMNLGAGRVVLQDDVRLDQAMRDGSFLQNPVFNAAMQRARQNQTALHLLTLLSENSSHGSMEYALQLVRLARQQNLEEVYLHVFFDGRSTEPGSAPELLEKLDLAIREIGTGKIVSGIGRGYALDRDHNYEKIRRAFDAFVLGKGRLARVEGWEP